MSEPTEHEPKPPTDPRLPCPICGSTQHTAGYHEPSEPSGYHDAGVYVEAEVNEE